jgi:hypothetical protein
MADHRRQLDSLAAVEKLLTVQLHGKPAAPTRQPKGPRGSLSDKVNRKRQDVVSFLRSRGPKSKQRLSEECGIAIQGPGCLSQVLDCDLFHVNPDGMVTLTPAGERLSLK